jgi:hypothetical protein
MENKTISLQELYNQVQTMLEDAGIPTATLVVEGKIVSYQHIKEGKYNPARMEPDKEIRVYINLEGSPSISSHHWSPSVVLETIRVELEKIKISLNPEDKVEDIQI